MKGWRKTYHEGTNQKADISIKYSKLKGKNITIDEGIPTGRKNDPKLTANNIATEYIKQKGF